MLFAMALRNISSYIQIDLGRFTWQQTDRKQSMQEFYRILY